MLWGTLAHFGDRIVFVRAGTLAESERITPDAHFYMRSKHPWITVPDDVRQYDTMPTAADGPLFSDEAKARFDAAVNRTS